MNWPRRTRQWITALRMAGVRNVPWLGLIGAILSGPVPRKVWRQRMRTCMTCPLYSKPGGVPICRSTHPDMLGLGCSCFLPFTAMTAKVYEKGCFGRDLDDGLGWPNHVWPTRWSRIKSTLDFILNRRHK